MFTLFERQIFPPEAEVLKLYIFDQRPSALTPKQMIEVCHGSKSELHLAFFYDASEETYLALPECASKEIPKYPHKTYSIDVLLDHIADVLDVLRQKKHIVIKNLRVCCPANLGRPEVNYITDDVNRTIKVLSPNELLFFMFEEVTSNTNSRYRLRFDTKTNRVAPTSVVVLDRRLEQDVTAYFSRQPTQMRYQIPRNVVSAAWVHHDDINERFAKYSEEDVGYGAFSDELIKLPPPKRHREEGVLAVYLLSHEYAIGNGYLATICSARHHEPSLFVVYNPEEDTYTILHCHVMPPSPRYRNEDTLTSIRPPLDPLSEDHFMEYLQVLKNPQHIAYHKLRLCLEAGIGASQHLSATTDRFIKKFLPDFLHLIYTNENMVDTLLYLMRHKSTSGFVLPEKNIMGSAIPKRVVLEVLSLLTQKTSRNGVQVDQSAQVDDGLYVEIDRYFVANTIPLLSHPQALEGLSACSLTAISPSNKGFEVNRPDSLWEPALISFGGREVVTYQPEEPESRMRSSCCSLS